MKESIIFYISQYTAIKDLTDEQIGRLFRAIFEKQLGNEVVLEDDIKIAFNFINNQLVVDEKKYTEKCEKNRNNGKKGGAPIGNQNAKKTTKQPKQPNGFKNNPNDNENDNDNDNENDNDNSKDKRERREKRTSRFSPPTPDEITRYAASVNLRIDVSAFYDYYSMRNWHLTNGDEMTDWKAAVRNWVRRDKDDARKKAASKTKKSSFCGYSHEDTDYNAMGLLLMQRQRQKDDHPPELQDSG